MNIRKSGVFGDKNSGGGLYEGVPAQAVSNRTWMVNDFDFIQSTEASAVQWTVSQIVGAAGTFAVFDDSLNGFARLTGSSTAGEGVSVQNDGSGATAREFLVPAAGRTIVVEWLVNNSLWNNVDWLIGLSSIDTSILDTDGALATGDDLIAFHQLESESTFRYVYSGGGGAVTRVDTGLTLTDATQYALGIRIYGTSTVQLYLGTRTTGVLGEPGGTVWNTRRIAHFTTTNAFAAGMALTMAYVANGTGPTIDFDRILAAQTR